MPNYLDPTLKPAEGFSLNLTDWGQPVWARFERPDNCMHCGGPLRSEDEHVQQVVNIVNHEDSGLHYTIVCYHPPCYGLVEGWRKELPHREVNTDYDYGQAKAYASINPATGEPYDTALRQRSNRNKRPRTAKLLPKLPAR